MMSSATLRTLNAIDWDFAVPRSGYVPPPHWYPGTFVPALSDAVIEALTPRGGVVFDPYGGIGTTGWSALRMARSCRVADVNPVAVLVAYVTTSLLSLTRTGRSASAALHALSRLTGRNDDLFSSGEDDNVWDFDRAAEDACAPAPRTLLAQIVAGPPVWDALKSWVDGETLAEMEALLSGLSGSRSTYVQLLGLCMVSAMIRSLSSQHASWGHIADNVRPREMKQQDIRVATMRWFERARVFISAPMVAGRPSPVTSFRAEVYMRDWSVPVEHGPGDADLLMTSPPYADAIDYTLAQRLSLYLLGYDDSAILALVSREIGARRKRFAAESRMRWSKHLCDAISDQVTWVKPEANVCLVLPHKDSGRVIGENELKSSLKKLGFDLTFQRERSIHQAHTRQSWTSIKKEVVLVFHRA